MRTTALLYDLVIIGSGVGSSLSAWTFASRGQRVAVVERKLFLPRISILQKEPERTSPGPQFYAGPQPSKQAHMPQK